MLNKIKLIGLLFCSLFFLSSHASDIAIKRLIVFGDSLQDAGNLYRATGIPTSPPYYHGHFCNGPIASEYLQQALSKQQPVHYINMAVGGALVAEPNPNPKLPYSISVMTQVKAFLLYYGEFRPGDLILINGGANNFLFALNKQLPYVHMANVLHIKRDFHTIIKLMIEHHAKQIILWDIPDITKAPIFATLIGQHFYSKSLTHVYQAAISKTNQQLADLVSGLTQQYPTIHIIVYSLNQAFTEVSKHPQHYAITQVKKACIDSIGLINPKQKLTICHHPNQYLFWDLVHPSTHIQKLIAKQLIKKL